MPDLLEEWVLKNCRFAQAQPTKSFQCKITYRGKVLFEAERQAVSQEQACSRFWWVCFNGDRVLIDKKKRAGYVCECTEIIPPQPTPQVTPQPPKKPEQGRLF